MEGTRLRSTMARILTGRLSRALVVENPHASLDPLLLAVSYTHLTLPTNREV